MQGCEFPSGASHLHESELARNTWPTLTANPRPPLSWRAFSHYLHETSLILSRGWPAHKSPTVAIHSDKTGVLPIHWTTTRQAIFLYNNIVTLAMLLWFYGCPAYVRCTQIKQSEYNTIYTLWKLSTSRENKKKPHLFSAIRRKQPFFTLLQKNGQVLGYKEKTVHVWYTRGNKIN